MRLNFITTLVHVRGRGLFWGKIKMPRFQFARLVFVTTFLTLLYGTIGLLGVAGLLQAQTSPTTTVVTSSPAPASDPGVRGGVPGAGGPIAGLTGAIAPLERGANLRQMAKSGGGMKIGL